MKLPRQVVDITGQKFNKLTFKSFAFVKNSDAYWLCSCDCGNTKVIMACNVKAGRTKSCGCVRLNFIAPNKTHGQSKTSLYSKWLNIQRRCYNPKSPAYKNYGGRGIKMCKRWLSSFEAFRDDIGKQPSLHHSLDRIDNDGDYCPDNIRWATRKVQSNNNRANVMVEYNNTTKTLSEWCDHLGLNYKRTFYRLRVANWEIDKAFSYEVFH